MKRVPIIPPVVVPFIVIATCDVPLNSAPSAVVAAASITATIPASNVVPASVITL